MFRFIKKYFFPISVAVVIFYLSIAPPSTFPAVPSIPYLDKIIHIIMYLVLAAALVWTVNKPVKPAMAKYYLIVIALPVLYGGALELIQQYFFPPRTGDWLDFLADAVGVLLGYSIMIKIDKRFAIKR